jgi:DNA-binding CsgD family transcriptional regulator
MITCKLDSSDLISKMPPFISIFKLMQTLTSIDHQRLHQSIQQIYTLHNPQTFGLDALTIVHQLVPSEIPSCFSTNFATAAVALTFLPDFPGLTPAMERVMHAYFGEHPIVQHLPITLNGAYKISDFINPAEFHRLEGLYQQYLGLLDIEDQMTLFLPDRRSRGLGHDAPPSADRIGFGLQRSRRNFTERDRLVLNLLRPHLAQAYANAQHYQKIAQDCAQLQQSLNCLSLVILDTDFQVQSIAPHVTTWLATYFTPSTASQPLPEPLQAWIKHQVANRTDDSDLPQPLPPLAVQLAERELTIRLVLEPGGDRYLLLFEEQSLCPSHSLAALGLSQRETELLDWLIQGKDTIAIAAVMGITKSTVRKHLENLYRKLGVTSRTAAIAHALGQLGLLNPAVPT